MNENRLTMQTLHLNLKAEYFDQIADGSKTHEYRLCTPFWEKRLAGRTFDRIEVKKGYPKRGDPDRTIVKPWRGFERQTISHPHFGSTPVLVFAIRVN